jgi:hypothetical protein
VQYVDDNDEDRPGRRMLISLLLNKTTKGEQTIIIDQDRNMQTVWDSNVDVKLFLKRGLKCC